MTVRATFDPDAIDGAASQINSAMTALGDVTATLAGISGGLLPDLVVRQLDGLKAHAHDMIADITDEAAALVTQLHNVACAYSDVENSIVCAFKAAL